MALVAADLASPAGEVETTLFYPGTLDAAVTARLNAYLTQGYALGTALTDTVAQDDLARNYAYYRAWSDVVNRITLQPASTSLAGEVSISRLQSQINTWIVARDAWRQAYLALLPDSSTVATPGVSQSIATLYRF
ncbi:MAG: hypothetical protein ABI119_05980 [Gemmatimonadaceae bacterium]